MRLVYNQLCLQNLPQLLLKILRTSAQNENPAFLYSSKAQQEKKNISSVNTVLRQETELKQRFFTSLSSLQKNLQNFDF